MFRRFRAAVRSCAAGSDQVLADHEFEQGGSLPERAGGGSGADAGRGVQDSAEAPFQADQQVDRQPALPGGGARALPLAQRVHLEHDRRLPTRGPPGHLPRSVLVRCCLVLHICNPVLLVSCTVQFCT